MTARLVPEYVERPAWETYAAFVDSLTVDDPDPDVLRDAVTRLRDGLLRGQAVKHAPADVLIAWLEA